MFVRNQGPANDLLDFLIYVAIFFAGWTLIVAFVWGPGPPSPFVGLGAKSIWWLGSAALYFYWLRRKGRIRETRMRFLGLTSPTQRVMLIGLAVIVALFAKDYLRLAVTSGRLPVWPDILTAIRRFDAPVIEEIVFTGVLLGRLRPKLAPIGAIAVTSLLFLAIHFPGWLILSIPIDAVKIVSVFLVGILCEILRLWTANLWPSIAAHAANNIGAEL